MLSIVLILALSCARWAPLEIVHFFCCCHRVYAAIRLFFVRIIISTWVHVWLPITICMCMGMGYGIHNICWQFNFYRVHRRFRKKSTEDGLLRRLLRWASFCSFWGGGGGRRERGPSCAHFGNLKWDLSRESRWIRLLELRSKCILNCNLWYELVYL